MKITFLGCGDAFGSGGRFNTCIMATAADRSFLIDCGASSMVAMRRQGIEPNAIGTIFITHLHGDHFGGLPFFLLDAQMYSRRREPLIIAGPPGISERLRQAQEVLFPGSSKVTQKFPIDVLELPAGQPTRVGDATATPYVMEHPSGAPSYALKVSAAGRTVTYTGDTQWTEALVAAADGADLLIAEALFFDRQVKFHLDYATLQTHLPELKAKRIILTHLGPDMLARLDDIALETASDGLVLEL